MNQVLILEKIDRAQDKVAQILGQAKHPQVASQVDHSYDDKYLLAEFICNMALSSEIACLSEFGLNTESLIQIKDWVNTGETVSMSFRAEEKCTFDRFASREVESASKSVTDSTFFGKVTNSVVTTIKEWFWKVEVAWEINVFCGVGTGPTLRLSGRRGEHVIKTTTEETPYPAVKSPAFDTKLDLTWFLSHLKQEGSAKNVTFSPCFSIDRKHASCATPRRNPDVNRAITYLNTLQQWCDNVSHFVRNKMIGKLDAATSKSFNLNTIDNPAHLFVPILPLFQEPTPGHAESAALTNGETETAISVSFGSTGSSVLLEMSSIHKFLNEESRLLTCRMQDLTHEFPASTSAQLVTAQEAGIIMVCGHVGRVCRSWDESLNYIEYMLRTQLIAAIGQEVTPADFDTYMSFNHNKFFNDTYKPKPMVHSVRRSPSHSPEGTISIEVMSTSSESSTESNANKPIETFCASKEGTEMGFSINAATRVSFSGERCLHGWLRHSFSGERQASDKISLNARARQFSGFIVVVGKVLDANNIDPQHAFLVQNRDEIEVPLSLSTIPTAKEFKDSIQSLSPEQQRFAEAFRSMQLGATLMGVLVIQVKPQLEAVLNLPSDSLTKEIKLTKELFSLFVDYQIPSDLLKFSGDEGEGVTTEDKVSAVKGHVKAMLDMMSDFKQEEVSERSQQVLYDDPFADRAFSAPRNQSADMMCLLQSSPSPPAPMMMRSMAPPPAPHCEAPGAQFKRKSKSQPTSAVRAENRSTSTMSSSSPSTTTAGAKPQEASIQPKANESSSEDSTTFDFSSIPAELDSRALELDQSMRPTIIKPADSWNKKAGAPLVANKKSTTSAAVVLGATEQKAGKDKAFDLLDALTRSGCLSLSHTTLHVIVCATVSFDDSVVDTVVLRNINPIERAERSAMVMAGTVHGVDRSNASPMVKATQLERSFKASPLLFKQIESEQQGTSASTASLLEM